MGAPRKIYNDDGLTRVVLAVVMVDLPNQDAEKAEQGQHAEGGGESSQHAETAGNKLAAP